MARSRCTSASAARRASSAWLSDDPELANTAPRALTRWQEKAGHHLRGYIIGARVDVALRPEGAESDLVLIAATRYFFDQYANL